MPSVEAQAVKSQLAQVKGDLFARKLDIAKLAAERSRLEQRLRHLLDNDDDSSEENSDDESQLFGTMPALPALPMGLLGQLDADVLSSKGSVARHVATGGAPGTQYLPATQGSLIAASEAPCLYSCFLAGEPLMWTRLNEVATFFCHWKRSFEITNLISSNLASESEKAHLRERYSFSVMEQHTVVNFVAWRRSVLLLLFVSGLCALGFSVFGDNRAAYEHMQSMHDLSQFEVSFERWKNTTWDNLPYVSCAEVDLHFADLLDSMDGAHQLAARNCLGVLHAGITCADTLDKVVDGCWQPSLCSQSVGEHCPGACNGGQQCKDTNGGKALDYYTFTKEFAKAMLHKLMEQLSKAELLKDIFSMITKFIACVFMLQAAIHWADWPRSNKFALYAWLVTFASPFLRSIVPTPLLIDWDPIDTRMEKFVVVTDQHFNITGRMTSLAQVAGVGCRGDVLQENVDNLWQRTDSKVHWWCGKLERASGWFPWSPTLKKGQLECHLLKNYMGVGDVATMETRVQKDKLCGMIRSSHVNRSSLDSVKDIVDVSWIRSVAYALVGSMSASLAFRVVLPEALSIAPGLLSAAIRIKVVAPQSYLPGIFIVIMPLLYVPMLWSFSILVVQSVGDPFLLTGITLLVFSPLAYMVLGVSRYVASPMSRNSVRSFTDCVGKILATMQLMSLLCLTIYFSRLYWRIKHIQESQEGIAAFLLEQAQINLLPLLIGHIDNIVDVLTSGVLWSFIFTCITEVYLTAIVGSDWMLQSSAEEWHSQGELCLDELQEQGSLGNVSAESLHRQRVASMTAMLELTARRKARDGPGH